MSEQKHGFGKSVSRLAADETNTAEGGRISVATPICLTSTMAGKRVVDAVSVAMITPNENPDISDECYCNHGWVCEIHSDQPWGHDDCGSAGERCSNPKCTKDRSRTRSSLP
jgi:hypothetical protein